MFLMFKFEIKNEYKKSRTGFFNTPHGKLETPNLAIVATHGHIKLLNKTDEKRANPDLTISNTFHLFVNKKVAEIKKAGGLHKWSGLKNPIMTDSGGFQVFSLGWGQRHGVGKILDRRGYPFQKPRSISPARKLPLDSRPRSLVRQLADSNHARSASETFFQRTSSPLNNVEILEEGVIFIFNGKKYELTPEKSMKIQRDLGADIIFAFDECTSPLHSYAYTKKAMVRTHRWAVRCLTEKLKNSCLRQGFGGQAKTKKKEQALFGIVQGGIYEDLRKKSSKFIGSLNFDGFGIGGCFGEKQMGKSIGWSLSGLPLDKPRHLLGIGKIKDIFIAVKQGIDLFDCVVPTREARHGVLYTKAGKLNIGKQIFERDKKMIEKNCGCWACRQGITRQEIYYHFKERHFISINQLNQYKSALFGKKLATIHNIYFFKRLFGEIREAVVNKKLEKLEKEYYNYLE